MIYSNFGSMYRFIYFLNVYSFRLLTTMAPKATKKPAAAPKKATKKPDAARVGAIRKPDAAPKKNLKRGKKQKEAVFDAVLEASGIGFQREPPHNEDDWMSQVPPSERYELRFRVKRALNIWARQLCGPRSGWRGEVYPEVGLLDILSTCSVDVQTHHESESD